MELSPKWVCQSIQTENLELFDLVLILFPREGGTTAPRLPGGLGF